MSAPAREPAGDAGRSSDARRRPHTPEGGGTREHISTFEWIVAGAGLVLLLGALGFLLADALADGPRTPVLEVRVDSIAPAGGRYRVHFTARNDGRGTAADVGISGELHVGDSVETSRATLDYVPGRSRRSGGLTFGTDPQRGTLRLWAEGYQRP